MGLALASCSGGATEKPATAAPAADPTHTAVITFLKKNLDDPASYQPARWGKQRAWRKDDANAIDLDSIKARATIFFELLKTEKVAAVASQKQFDETVASLKQLQDSQDSLIHTVDTTRIGTVLTHAYRAKNKMGALQLDSAQFIVYTNGTVKRF